MRGNSSEAPLSVLELSGGQRELGERGAEEHPALSYPPYYLTALLTAQRRNI